MNTAKWLESKTHGGQVTQNEQLILTTGNQSSDSNARVTTRCYWEGDFDIQVDYSGPGWIDSTVTSDAPNYYCLARMGLSIDKIGAIAIQVTSVCGRRSLSLQSSFPVGSELPSVLGGAAYGKFRIIRKGSDITFKYMRDVENWVDFYTLSDMSSPVQFFLSCQSFDAPASFTTYFDNFMINSCSTTTEPFSTSAVLPKAEDASELPDDPQLPAVKIGENGLTIDGEPFRFIGANSIHMGYYLDYGLSIEDAIANASQNGIKVIRIYLWGGDGPWAGALEDMDMVLHFASIYGVYVIPVITDLCPGPMTNEEYFELRPHGDLTSQTALDSFKEVINNILNRENIFNGRIYKDDTTILAWDVANEPVINNLSSSIVHDWLDEVTTYVKSIDPNHLVTLGVASWIGDAFDNNHLYYQFLNVPNLDFFSFHIYPPAGYSAPATGSSDSYLNSIRSRVHSLLSMGKPVVLEEFGFTSYRNLVNNLGRVPTETELMRWLKVYQDQMDVSFGAGASGVMFWGWGVPQTKLIPADCATEDHDVTEMEFCDLLKNYVIPD